MSKPMYESTPFSCAVEPSDKLNVFLSDSNQTGFRVGGDFERLVLLDRAETAKLIELLKDHLERTQ